VREYVVAGAERARASPGEKNRLLDTMPPGTSPDASGSQWPLYVELPKVGRIAPGAVSGASSSPTARARPRCWRTTEYVASVPLRPTSAAGDDAEADDQRIERN